VPLQPSSAAGRQLVERALAAGEGQLAANGALVCLTGDRTGRSPKDKHLEDVSPIHDKIWWGKVNTPDHPRAVRRGPRRSRSTT
jgi:ATP-dependent phosphoenolpyruvate carboxykinase